MLPRLLWLPTLSMFALCTLFVIAIGGATTPDRLNTHPVSLAHHVADADDAVALSTPDPTDLTSADPNDYEYIEPADHWRRVQLVITNNDGSRVDIELLRPLPWLEVHDATVGASVFIDMPELGVRADAEVTAIASVTEIQRPEPGTRNVIGRFVTHGAEVLDLHVADLDEPLGVTAAHPFWSLDRDMWVSAGELGLHERLATRDGETRVTEVKPRANSETVYNLEVHKDHTYFVSDIELWAHNNCKANSEVWKGFKNHHGTIKTNGKSGKKKQYYEWDHTHNNIEVYNRRGEHIGVMDPLTGQMVGPAVKGRILDGI